LQALRTLLLRSKNKLTLEGGCLQVWIIQGCIPW
jgi:hypothetical protein